MKPTIHDPLDDLIAAALHDALTPAERAQFETRLANDPAARAAYQEAQLMHDLLEKTHAAARTDSGFEQRMVSGVRRKIAEAQRPCETAWESLVIIGTSLWRFLRARRIAEYMAVLVIVMVLAGVALGPITSGIKKANQNKAMQEARMKELVTKMDDERAMDSDGMPATTQMPLDANNKIAEFPTSKNVPALTAAQSKVDESAARASAAPPVLVAQSTYAMADSANPALAPAAPPVPVAPPAEAIFNIAAAKSAAARDGDILEDKAKAEQRPLAPAAAPIGQPGAGGRGGASIRSNALADTGTTVASTVSTPATPSAASADLSRKLIRNAALELEVKSFQAAMDQITALTKADGGYVDSNNSQRGGNGKLQGNVVVKVLPQNLDDFLLKLRDLGELKNQTLSTEDVSREYVDTQARLDNARRMETQLQQLLQRDNGKVSDLLMVERELARVRGEIEQMQGQLKLYDFQVQYATVTMQIREKDLNQAAAYLLREQDNFSLLATDVETAFQQARRAADDFKAQVLIANLNHNSGSDVSARVVVMVPPDQTEPFLAQVRTLGRVANFTRQTQRVARDGGDSDQPADRTLTERDKVEVQIEIGSDDESRKQVALTVVTSAVDDALEQAKSAVLADAGGEILSSSLNKTQDGQSTAQLSVRVPGKNYHALLDSFRALGRASSFSLQRDGNSGPGAGDDDAPVIFNLSLTDDEAPLQQTRMAVLAADVDGQSQQIKQDAAAAGAGIKASNFQRRPDGTETAQLVFRLPMAKYPAFVEVLKKLGKVELLTVSRNDRPDETRSDGSAPAEIDLTLHSLGDLVADNDGFWPTLRETFSEGAGALFGSVRVIGVGIAFLAPWLISLAVVAWGARRVYAWCKR